MLQNSDLRNSIAVSLGAIPGALSRYYLTLWFTQRFGAEFPYGTFFINVTGCFVMGFFVTLVTERITIAPEVRLLVATGFLGAYTTFSTYGLDTFNLLSQRNYAATALYWLGSAVVGIIGLFLGVYLARSVPG